MPNPFHTLGRITVPAFLPAAMLLLAPALFPGWAHEALAQDPEAALQVQSIVVEPEALQVEQGGEASFTVRALDAEGNEVDAPLRITRTSGAIVVDEDEGLVRGLAGGNRSGIVISLLLPPGADRDPITVEVPVEVTHPSVTAIHLEAHHPRLFEGTATSLAWTVEQADGSSRDGAVPEFGSSDASVVTVDRFGDVVAHAPGTAMVSAEVDGVRGEWEVEVEPFPAVRMELMGGADEARTGDVLSFEARFLDSDGNEVEGIPASWGHTFHPADERIQPGATALVDEGRFVAQEPGIYRVTASAGPLQARHSVEVGPRHAVQRVNFRGQGRVSDQHTSDFWVFEGNDGRDYAISGTWGSDGWAFMWDVTDPANMVKTDSVQVDARTVNDVKVSPDARYAIMTREGASDRRNGVVILDLADPAHPVIATEYNEGLTGGVHNAFPEEDYLYALSGGQKYVIIDVEDLYNPRTVGEVQHENCRIHDVWVLDGMGYSAQWGCGILVYDVGNGAYGGTPENPVFVSQMRTPGDRTHAVFPYYQESTGSFLVFAGDEILSRGGRALEGGLSREPYDPETDSGGTPSHTAGYIHILDFTDMENPRKVARYKVPEYGTHNVWVEDDVMYQAYYEGGMRVVDVSGDLMGNLATQGREMAVFKSYDPAGYIANAPMVWSAMPYRGMIYFSDWNSGMWAVELEPRQPVALQEDDEQD
ncbi:MAG: hypothetical protein EA352_07195 [Gemmatimonadales bacterium]|nr:MAG: hypothetical protein EA352_07195 [Gemmatimonadales bacterium]